MEDIATLDELAEMISSASLCGLGQTSPNPVLTTLRHFRKEYEEHILEKKCRALVCKALIAYQIQADKCQGCDKCRTNCPYEAVYKTDQPTNTLGWVHAIDPAKCQKCGTCIEVCPSRFSAILKVTGITERLPEKVAVAV
jgi:ferredoxin